MEREDIVYQSISRALHCLPADVISLCGLESIINIAQGNAGKTISDIEARLKRKPLYRSFIDHFISVKEVGYVLEKLAIKLAGFQKRKP